MIQQDEKCTQRNDSLQTEQFIVGLNDEGKINEILREVAALEDIEDAMS